MKRTAILQSNYIPWKGYFDIINMVDEFIIFDEVQYTKNDWRNRNLIKTKQGVQWLTIPVRQDRLAQKICETKVVNEQWNKKHWTAIKTNYGKAKYFNFYKPFFEELYLSCTTRYLSEINLAFVVAISTMLEIKTKISLSTSFNLINGKTERLVDLCKQSGADEYISGPSAISYIDQSSFENAGIRIRFMDYSNYPEYQQLYPPFVHEVSIIDVLFNTGPDAKYFLISNLKERKSDTVYGPLESESQKAQYLS